MLAGGGEVMTTVIAKRVLKSIIVLAMALAGSSAVHAGPELTFYLTVPLGGPSLGHVFGLRLDRNVASPDVRIITPASPLNRRPLLDLQLGADSALRLDLNRRLIWDISAQRWRPASLPATFTLRMPSLAAARANPLQNQPGKSLMKLLPIEP
jgi:hypothetical protein